MFTQGFPGGNPTTSPTPDQPAGSSPFQPLPLQETVEVDAVEVVSKRGHAQVLMGQPVETGSARGYKTLTNATPL